MRIQRFLAATAAVTALATLTACEGDDPAAARPAAASSASPSAGSAAPSATPTRVPEANTELPSAGSLAELKKFVHYSVDCAHFSTDPETVAVQSIDHLPAVDGDAKAWGIRERGLCGEPAGARGRAHGLAWLSTVDDMRAFEAHEKAAQLKELRQYGHLRATRSTTLLGRDIIVETTDAASRHGLYQQRFLHLNCVPGFTAPQGYRFEKSMTEGCVLTNYEGEGGTGE
ncbi:hypothetical protein [Streptomyces abikoensis]|uniref:hypothetical protein n=1 Tax=Streptomyces abikoensis TaxID=97398 RepID=UPI003696C7D9